MKRKKIYKNFLHTINSNNNKEKKKRKKEYLCIVSFSCLKKFFKNLYALSPFLFILVAEGLTSLLKNVRLCWNSNSSSWTIIWSLTFYNSWMTLLFRSNLLGEIFGKSNRYYAVRVGFGTSIQFPKKQNLGFQLYSWFFGGCVWFPFLFYLPNSFYFPWYTYRN